MANSDPLQPLLPGHPLKAGALTQGDVDLASLSDRLGHSFERAELAIEALTHRGTLDKRPDLKAAFPHGNERLEFLGDRVLSLAMADLLLRRFPHEREGQLARRHAALVSARTLGEIAEAIGPDFDIRDRVEDVDTLGGLIFSALGRIPVRGEVVQALPGFEFHILDADPRRIKRVRIVRKRVLSRRRHSKGELDTAAEADSSATVPVADAVTAADHTASDVRNAS